MMTVHINRPSSSRFHAMVRRHGYRKWQAAGPGRKNRLDAIMDMARTFGGGDYKRGCVLLTADYYDPLPIVEMKRS